MNKQNSSEPKIGDLVYYEAYLLLGIYLGEGTTGFSKGSKLFYAFQDKAVYSCNYFALKVISSYKNE
jgi:hypothetical protein